MECWSNEEAHVWETWFSWLIERKDHQLRVLGYEELPVRVEFWKVEERIWLWQRTKAKFPNVILGSTYQVFMLLDEYFF